MSVTVCFIAEAFGGIKKYTDFLRKSLEKNENVRTTAIWLIHDDLKRDSQVLRSIFRETQETTLYTEKNKSFSNRLIRILKKKRCQIVHFQYEDSLFRSYEYFYELVQEIKRKTRKKIIITLHSVRTTPEFLHAFKKISKVVDQLIVHQMNSKKYLLSHGFMPNNITVIPHGTPKVPHPGPNAKKRFFRTNKFKIAMVGFIRSNKGFEIALRSLMKDPNLEIVVAGKVIDKNVFKELKTIKNQSLAKVSIIPRFLRDDETFKLISEADCVILPYPQTYFSSSGILHLTVALHKPVIVSNSPKFDEIKQRIPICVVKDENYLKAVKLLQHDVVRKYVIKELRNFARETTWDKVAAKTIRMYQKVLSPKPTKKVFPRFSLYQAISTSYHSKPPHVLQNEFDFLKLQ